MKARKKIISLNLALLLLASLALPAGATQAARTDLPGEEGTLLTRRLEQIAAGFTDGAAVLLEADAAPCGAGGTQLAFQCFSAQPVKVRLFVLDETLAPVCEPREAVVFQPQG